MVEETSPFEVCIVDADSLIYQIAYTQTSPALCIKSFDARIDEIIKATEAKDVYVFIKGEGNFRMSYEETYKGNRKNNIEPDVRERVNDLYEHAKTYCIEADGAEADDYVTSLAHQSLMNNTNYIVAHIDKDLNCIPGWHYNFRTGAKVFLTQEESYLFLMMQLLQGDATDNIKGIKGIGPKTAEKILAGVPVENMLTHVYAKWRDAFSTKWQEPFTVCANLIYMRESTEDNRPLTFEELEERLKWKKIQNSAEVLTHTGIGYLSQNDLKGPSDSSTQSSDQPGDNT